MELGNLGNINNVVLDPVLVWLLCLPFLVVLDAANVQHSALVEGPFGNFLDERFVSGFDRPGFARDLRLQESVSENVRRRQPNRQ
jgi:hypothetical protein